MCSCKFEELCVAVKSRGKVAATSCLLSPYVDNNMIPMRSVAVIYCKMMYVQHVVPRLFVVDGSIDSIYDGSEAPGTIERAKK